MTIKEAYETLKAAFPSATVISVYVNLHWTEPGSRLSADYTIAVHGPGFHYQVSLDRDLDHAVKEVIHQDQTPVRPTLETIETQVEEVHATPETVNVGDWVRDPSIG